MILAGSLCMDSLRLEKGYRLWGADVHTEYDPYQSGMGWTVKLGKSGEFIGKQAASALAHTEPSIRLVCLTIDDPTCVLFPYDPYYEGAPVGNVTTSNRVCSIGTTIAYTYLAAELSHPGTVLSVGLNQTPALVVSEPLFDPGMHRIKQ